MKLIDVNVLVHASRVDAEDHDRYRAWLDEVVNGAEAYGIPTLALSGFLRIVTHPKVFAPPTPLAKAIAFTDEVRSGAGYVEVAPGARHWRIFVDLVKDSGAKGNAIPDAYFAALAIETGSIWMTVDRGFARFRSLRWQHPLS